jgi:hypothetical protein
MKKKCEVCGKMGIVTSKEDRYFCPKFCSFVANNYCYLLPGGGIEITKDLDHIKKVYEKRIRKTLE